MGAHQEELVNQQRGENLPHCPGLWGRRHGKHEGPQEPDGEILLEQMMKPLHERRLYKLQNWIWGFWGYGVKRAGWIGISIQCSLFKTIDI